MAYLPNMVLDSRSSSLTSMDSASEIWTSMTHLEVEAGPRVNASKQHKAGSWSSLIGMDRGIGSGSSPSSVQPLAARACACPCFGQCLPPFATGLATALLLTIAALIGMKVCWDPKFYYNDEVQPDRNVYILLFSMALSIYGIGMGAPPFKVLPAMGAALAIFGVLDADEILSGFAKQGAWVPQCVLVIITAVRESGVLEEVLPWMMGMRVRRLGRIRTYLQLQIACAVIGLLVGVTPAVATAMPLVMQWARSEGFHCGPPLMLMVASTTCGSLMLISSVPTNIFIRDYIASNLRDVDVKNDLSLIAALAPMMIIFAIVGFYGAIAWYEYVPAESPVHQGAAAAVAHEQFSKWARSARRKSIVDCSGSCMAQANQIHISSGADSADEQSEVHGEEADMCRRLVYTVEFAVNQGSTICGLLPSTAGLMGNDQIKLLRISRKDAKVRLSQNVQGGDHHDTTMTKRVSGRFSTRVEFVLGDHSESREAVDGMSISQWKFHAGDLLVVRCSAAGIIAMRATPGVFPLHSLPWIDHELLTHRRHQRRLFECAVAKGSTLIGQTLQEILSVPSDHGCCSDADAGSTQASQQPRGFLDDFQGIPLGGWRCSSASCIQSLDFCTDVVHSGDVLLIDAYLTFPDLRTTRMNFLVASLVANSQAPRHGRNLDRTRGMMGIAVLLAANVMVHSFGWNLLLAANVMVLFFCAATRAVHTQQALESLSWPMVLTFGAGGSISAAILKTGLAHKLATGIIRLGEATGSEATVVLALALLAQLLANVISNAPTGFIMAPLAVEVARRTRLTAHNIGILLVITCNMTLITPFSRGVNAAICGPAGFTPATFLKFGLPAQVITTVVVVCWVGLDNE